MLNDDKNINVHNPVQINVGQQENSIQYIIRKLKKIDIITTSRFANTFVVQLIKNGLFTICIAIPFFALWIFLMIEIALYFWRQDLSLYERFLVPFSIAHEFFIEKNMVGELLVAIFPLIVVWGTGLICLYIGTYVAAKIVYWNDKEKANAFHKLMFYTISFFALLELKKSKRKKPT